MLSRMKKVKIRINTMYSISTTSLTCYYARQVRKQPPTVHQVVPAEIIYYLSEIVNEINSESAFQDE